MPSPPQLQHRAVVIGAAGFVGAAVVEALERQGALVIPLRAPRLSPAEPRDLEEHLATADGTIAALAENMRGSDVVINAAGRSEAGSTDVPGLCAANALLPGILARAAAVANVTRFIHLSSGAVQGDADVLDSSRHVRPFSAYSYSKALGEQLVLRNHTGAVVYRPAGVQGVRRPATRNLVEAAGSWLATAPAGVKGNSPQALVENVADAAAFLALSPDSPPPIVHHPSEGLSVDELLELLSGRPPREVPASLARGAVRALSSAEKVVPSLAARRRRLEVMWFGQAQARSWLTEAGWEPVVDKTGWRALGESLG